MLLIFGVRVRSRSIGAGTFHCPHCSGDRAYAHKHARQWFTLFFIPIIPMKEIGEFVQCETCQQGFPMDVLDRPTSASLAEQMIAATREAVAQLILLDDSATTRAGAARAISDVTGQQITDEQVQADLDNLDLSQLTPRLRILSRCSTSTARSASSPPSPRSPPAAASSARRAGRHSTPTPGSSG